MWMQRSAVSYREAMAAARTPLGLVGLILYTCIDAVGLTVLVFLRSRFGTRLLTPLHLILGWTFLQFVFLGDTTHVGEVYIGAFLLVGGARQAAIYARSFRRNKAPVLSRSAGDPYSFWYRVFRNHWLIVIVMEPLTVVLLGVLLRALSPAVLALYFHVAAFLMCLQGLYLWRLAREERLDQQDMELMARGFAASREEHHAAPSEGSPVAPTTAREMPELSRLRAWSEKQRATERRAP